MFNELGPSQSFAWKQVMEDLLDRQAPPSLGRGGCVNRRGGKPGPSAEPFVFFGRFRRVFFDGSASFGGSTNALFPRATSRTHSLSCKRPERTGEFSWRPHELACDAR